MIGTNLLERYLIESELGRGGVGVVYRARDTLLDRAVAIKFLTDAQLGSQGRTRLLHEAQAAAKLSHPNIISIFDAGQVGSSSFIIMELLEGSSLYEHRPDTLLETLGIARQICQALEHAHAHGVIHRDLKPENVIISPSGLAKLTDFGLARTIASRISVEGAIIGTVYYIPPEQALGKEIDSRADLYSLGVMLYELAAGKLPYEADNPLAVISQHLYAPLVPPSSYNPEIPASLDDVITRLMSKQVEERPANAAEVRLALESIIAELETGIASARRSSLLVPPSPFDRLVRGRFVGRDREFDEVKLIWKRAISGGGEHVLFISGESGVGKSPFLRAASALAEVSGGRVLRGECYPDGGTPYSPIAQIVREVLPAALPELVLADLIKLAPDLQVRYPGLRPNPPLDPQAEQQRLFESITALCALLAAEKPLMMVVEDVQWADGGTLSLLRHLARRSRNSQPELPLLILMSYRDVELGSDHLLNEIIFDLVRERLAGRIKLSRFDKEQTRLLLSVMFQQEANPAFLDAIYRETEGNLFYVEEVCRSLIEDGTIYHADGHWHQPADMADIQIPQSIRMAVQSRVNKLPPAGQEVLFLAALIGREFDFNILHQACELDEDALVEYLEQAERAQLIEEAKRTGREAFVFSHGLTMSTLRDSLSGIRRRRLHRRIAAAIELVHPDDFEGLASHYSQGGDEQKALESYVRAGDRARSVYANREAIYFYSEALELLPPDSHRRFELLDSRAAIYALIGERSLQKADVQEMLALADALDDDRLRCDALLAKAEYEISGNSLDAQPFAERAAELARDLQDPVKEGQALLMIAQVNRAANNQPLVRSDLERAIALFREHDRPDLASAGLHWLSLTLQSLGDSDAALQAVEEALQLSRQAGDRRQEAISLRRLSIIYESRLMPKKALPLAEEALALHRQLGDRAQECHALNLIGLIFNMLGRYDEMEKYLSQGIEVAWEIQHGEAIQYISENYCSMVYYRQGAYEASLNFLDHQIEKLRRANLNIPADFMIMARVETLNFLGQHRQALNDLDYLFSITEDLSSPAIRGRIQEWRGLMMAELGDESMALQLLDDAHAQFQDSNQEREKASIFTMQAYVKWLQGGEGNLLDGKTFVQQALDYLPGHELNRLMDRGNALIVSALIERDLGNIEVALRHSREAFAILDRARVIPAPENWLIAHVNMLYDSGNQAEGDQVLQIAYERYKKVLNQIQNPLYRQSYENNVRAVREIKLEWERHFEPKPERST